MNIFFLELNPSKNAKRYYNKHCIKIILEITQILYAAHWFHGSDWKEHVPYKKTHINHPITQWVRFCKNNYMYALNVAFALCDEYTFRYKKIHKCLERLRWLQQNIPSFSVSGQKNMNSYYASKNNPEGCSPVPLAMPSEYHDPDLLKAYRSYYLMDKNHIRDKHSSSQINLETIHDEWCLK
jgi:hypothetical protein